MKLFFLLVLLFIKWRINDGQLYSRMQLKKTKYYF